MKTVKIAGAGFSGLTLAYQLLRHGMHVEIYEKQSRAGGLIHTQRSADGLIETAANAFLADQAIEDLFADLNVPFAETKSERKNRYIYWKEPRRWPLTTLTTAKLTWVMGRARFGKAAVFPKAGESVFDWALRTVNAEFEERLLSPALQGVFAGDTKRLSATLTLGSLLGERAPKGKLRGSVAPRDGMGALLDALAKRIQDLGGSIRFGEELPWRSNELKVLATSAWSAAEIVKPHLPALSETLRHCESLALVTTTIFYENGSSSLRGFGCLFPQSQGFKASGALFNSCIFSNRSSLRSETWIMGGALEPGLIAKSDSEILDMIAQDRAKLTGHVARPISWNITRWPRAIPHYTVQWEKQLAQLEVPKPLYLHGNYLGVLGLSKIYQRSIKLAKRIKAENG
ncbi:MAG: NAD(P)/FAD-dependent oxidoreductase [Pseudobdellovibrionaceae bacterium]